VPSTNLKDSDTLSSDNAVMKQTPLTEVLGRTRSDNQSLVAGSDFHLLNKPNPSCRRASDDFDQSIYSSLVTGFGPSTANWIADAFEWDVKRLS
jgi:hypothetical protein